MSNQDRRELSLFLALSYGISWLIWLPLVLGQTGLKLVHIHAPIFPWVPAGTIGPLAAALITQIACKKNLRAFRFWTSLRQILVGTIAGMLCILVARWLLSGIGLTRNGFSAWDWAALLDFRYYFVPNLIGGPLGEEPGWRGFALPRLQSSYGPTSASLLLGAIWAAWHLPLFLVHGWTTAPVWVFFLILIGLSVIMTYGYNLSGGSVITAILMHNTFNAGGGPLYSFLAKATLREHPNPDFIVACAFFLMAAALVGSTGGRLGARRQE